MPKQRKSVCVLSTGGTITMQKTVHGYAPVPGYLQDAMAQLPELTNPDMPLYTIHEFAKPIDSANMTPAEWYKIACFIEENAEKHAGFVILHGTDTMAYTASALSFMLENLNKPVILTGSQLPLFETRNDARENLINALLLAGNYVIPEVCVYFNNKLFRGNRTKKIDAVSFSAFSSPNFPVLANIGTQVHVHHDLLRPVHNKQLSVRQFKSVVIHAQRIFPGFSLQMLEYFLNAPLQALILETYGVGTTPDNPEFLGIIEQLIAKNVLIINCSQCMHANIKMSNYVVSNALQNAGVISGGDMTVEAVIAKLFYLFSCNLNLVEIKEQMGVSLRGEL